MEALKLLDLLRSQCLPAENSCPEPQVSSEAAPETEAQSPEPEGPVSPEILASLVQDQNVMKLLSDVTSVLGAVAPSVPSVETKPAADEDAVPTKLDTDETKEVVPAAPVSIEIEESPAVQNGASSPKAESAPLCGLSWMGNSGAAQVRATSAKLQAEAEYLSVKVEKTGRVLNEGPGYSLLKKMGWSDGTGLGAAREGIVEPILTKHMPDRRGLGAADDDSPSSSPKASPRRHPILPTGIPRRDRTPVVRAGLSENWRDAKRKRGDPAPSAAPRPAPRPVPQDDKIVWVPSHVLNEGKLPVDTSLSAGLSPTAHSVGSVQSPGSDSSHGWLQQQSLLTPQAQLQAAQAQLTYAARIKAQAQLQQSQQTQAAAWTALQLQQQQMQQPQPPQPPQPQHWPQQQTDTTSWQTPNTTQWNTTVASLTADVPFPGNAGAGASTWTAGQATDVNAMAHNAGVGANTWTAGQTTAVAPMGHVGANTWTAGQPTAVSAPAVSWSAAPAPVAQNWWEVAGANTWRRAQ